MKIKFKIFIGLMIAFIAFTMISVPSIALISEAGSSWKQGPKETGRIVVEAPLPRNLPRSPELWSRDLKKISRIVDRHNGEIDYTSLEYAYSIINVSEENRDSLVQSLKEMGYIVSNDTLLSYFLDESVSIIGGPYTWYASDEHRLTGEGQIITIVDSGLDINHPDFPTWKIEAVYNTFDSTNREDVTDVTGHGTHMASIAAGTGDAYEGTYTGVAPGASLKIVKACHGAGCVIERITDGIRWARQNGTDIISLSFGDEFPTKDMCECSSSAPARIKGMCDEIQNAIDSGIFVVAAAGNEGPGTGSSAFPACTDRVFAAGNTVKDRTTNERFHYGTGEYTADFHPMVIIDGNVVYDTSWRAYDDQLSEADSTFFQRIFDTGSDTAEVRVSIEAQHRRKECFSGETSDTETYWYGPYYKGRYVLVEVAARPIYTSWDCLIFWHGFEVSWNSGVNTIFVRVESADTLKDLVNPTSSRGPSAAGYQKPDVVSPGTHICAARADGTTAGALTCGDDQYVRGTGSSCAAPHVAGLAALVKEAYEIKTGGFLFPDQVIDAIEKADDILLNDVNEEGHGRINVKNSVNFITCNSDGTALDNECHEICGGNEICEDVSPRYMSKRCNENNREWYCGSTCSAYLAACEDDYSGCNADPRCDEKYPSVACDGGTCDNNCQCVIQDSCIDTDGGKNYDTRGIVSGYQGGIPYEHTDECPYPDMGIKYVTEYYCDGTNWVVETYDCKELGDKYYCLNGYCRESGSGGGGCAHCYAMVK